MIKPIYLLLLSTSSVASAQTQISATDALKLAAQNRLTLASAKLRIAGAQASARALGTYSPLEFGIGASSRSDTGATDQDLYLSQDIDLFGRRSAGKNLGAAGVRLAQAEYGTAASALQTEVLSAFAVTVAAKHQRDVATELQTVAELNRAVAVAQSGQTEVALRLVENLVGTGGLKDYALAHGVLGDLYQRMGRTRAAENSYHSALEKTNQASARQIFTRKIAELNLPPKNE